MRSLLGGLTVALSNLEMFTVVKTFPGLVNSIQDYGVFYLYSTSCISAAIFVFFLVEDDQN